MPTNTNLDRDTAVELIKGLPTLCPACKKGQLQPRKRHKDAATDFVCPCCGEVFKPAKLI